MNWFIVVMCALILIIFTGILFYSLGYKDGQIAVMTGTVQYCLEKQEDLELVWIYREEGCER
jgi:hypothetical protein